MAGEQGGRETATRFSVGRVIAQSISVFMRAPAVFAGIGILAAVPNVAFTAWYDRWYGTAMEDLAGALDSFWIVSLMISGLTGVGVAIDVAAYAVAEAAFTIGFFDDLRGGSVTFARSLRGCGSAWRRLLALSLLLGGGTAVVMAPLMLMAVHGQGSLTGIYLLGGAIVIGVIVLLVVWWVAVPAMVVEGIGALASLGRSYVLTSGHRWGVFSFLVLLGVVRFAGGYGLEVVADQGSLAYEIADRALDVAYMLASAMLTVVGYHHLRVEAEGSPVNEVAAVFD